MAETPQTQLETPHPGDPESLGLLLTAQQDRLYRVCLRMVGNRDDAAEVCQDAMAKIVEHVGSYRGEAKLTTWMTRIAMNQSLTHLRRRKVRKTTSLDASYTTGDGDQASALRARLEDGREPGPAERVQQKEQLHLLEQAIAELDDDFRSVLVLRDIDEMDYQEIASTLEIKVGTVKSRLFRARLALRQEMLALQGEQSE